jgi:DNA-binding CsgD family transcriptional regulator
MDRNGISAETLGNIRAIVGKRGGEQAAALTAIGLLCASGVGLRAVIRDLPDLIRRVLSAETIGFFWSDDEGRMADAYVEKPYFLSPDVVLSCQRYREEDPHNWPSFTENVMAGPVTGYLLPYQTPAFYGSPHYAFTYERIGVRHVLDAVVHDGMPRGCYLLMRSGARGAFTEQEIDTAGAIAALTAIAFRTNVSAPLSTRLFHAGLIVFDKDDRLVFRNLRAHQSLWMLARPDDEAMHEASEDSFDKLAARFCGDLVKEARRDSGLTRSISNSWGDFEILCELDGRGSAGLRFLQRRPLAAHLAAELLNLNLPPRRMTVCWLALMGLPRKEISRLADMSVDTVGEHLNALFAQFGVATVQELTARFLA